MIIRAVVMIKIKMINVRCFKSGFLLNFFFLARRDNGANQHLRTIRGVEMESDPKIKDSLCQEDTQWFLNRIRATTETMALCEMAVAQSFFLGAIKMVSTIPVDKNSKVTIIIYFIQLTPSPLLLTRRLSPRLILS